jgi:hypothetical protein
MLRIVLLATHQGLLGLPVAYRIIVCDQNLDIAAKKWLIDFLSGFFALWPVC